MSKIGGEVQENCSTNSPVYLKKIFNDVKMQKDIILLSSSILNRLSLFGGLNEADLPTSSGLFALMDKVTKFARLYSHVNIIFQRFIP